MKRICKAIPKRALDANTVVKQRTLAYRKVGTSKWGKSAGYSWQRTPVIDSLEALLALEKILIMRTRQCEPACCLRDKCYGGAFGGKSGTDGARREVRRKWSATSQTVFFCLLREIRMSM